MLIHRLIFLIHWSKLAHLWSCANSANQWINMAASARLLFVINFSRRQRKQWIYRHFYHDFDCDEFQSRYCFSKESVEEITKLEPYLCHPTLRSHSMSAYDQVLLALRYAIGNKMKTTGDTLGDTVLQKVFCRFFPTWYM